MNVWTVLTNVSVCFFFELLFFEIRSFGMTPVIPRNRGGRMEAQNVQNGYHMNMPQFSKYNPWGH